MRSSQITLGGLVLTSDLCTDRSIIPPTRSRTNSFDPHNKPVLPGFELPKVGGASTPSCCHNPLRFKFGTAPPSGLAETPLPSKCSKTFLRPELRLGPRWGSLQRFPDPVGWFPPPKNPTLALDLSALAADLQFIFFTIYSNTVSLYKLGLHILHAVVPKPHGAGLCV